jgi:hypothetical protein
MRAFFLTDKGVKILKDHLGALARGHKVDAYELGDDIRELVAPGAWHFIEFDVPVIRRPDGVNDRRAHVTGAVLARRADETIEKFLDKFVGVWLSVGKEYWPYLTFVTGCEIEAQPITLAQDQFFLGNMIVHFTEVCRTLGSECPESLRDQRSTEQQAS